MDNKKGIAICRGNGPFANAKDALLSLNIDWIKGKSVLIKPNAGRNAASEKGINTHPEAVAGVIEALQELGASNIAVGESPILGVKALESLEISGIAAVARKYKCDLIDFDAVLPREVKITNGRVLEQTKICSPLYDYDLILSLPVAKCHMHTGVTLGIKNMKGCLYKREKVRYHQLEYKEGMTFPETTLDSAISDLATILLPSITVIDGYIGMEGLGPSGGEPLKSDFAVASADPVGADMAGCLMMGLNPHDIPHLRIISERMGMSLDPDDYMISPKDFNHNIVVYKTPPKDVAIEYPDVVLCDKESCSACLSTVMLFLKRFKNDMAPYVLDDGLLHLAIGKGVTASDVPKGTIVIGNCTSRLKEHGLYVSGCPPVATRIYRAVTGSEPKKNEP